MNPTAMAMSISFGMTHHTFYQQRSAVGGASAGSHPDSLAAKRSGFVRGDKERRTMAPVRKTEGTIGESNTSSARIDERPNRNRGPWSMTNGNGEPRGKAAYRQAAGDVLAALDVDAQSGLSKDEAAA